MNNVTNKHHTVFMSTVKLLQTAMCCVSSSVSIKQNYCIRYKHTHIHVDTQMLCSNCKLYVNV